MFKSTLVPRIPFTAAEEVVDFVRIDDHILGQRRSVEAALKPLAARYGESVILHRGIPGYRQLGALEHALVGELVATYMFGYEQAEAEINRLRDSKGLRPRLIAAASTPETAWEIGPWVKAFAHGKLVTFNHGCVAWYERLQDGPLDWEEQLRDRVRRALHNLVLDSIGQVLNAGRTLAALGGSTPTAHTITAAVAPTRYAMRSEQLDTNTCEPCDTLHGTVTVVGSPEYFATLPPAGCLGGGRCRGIEVYSDDPADFS